MNSKSIFKSKTAIVNALVALAGFIPGVGSWVSENPTATVTLIGAVNIILRLVTKSKVVLFDK